MLTPAPMVRPFPVPGRGLTQAYRELHLAVNGTPEQKNALGDLRSLPRPWEPASVRQPQLRRELWDWLEAVVTWVNIEYVWDVAGVVPACWPRHPHLVHELAVLADQRHRAGLGFTSDALEEWHRYALPAFTERTRARVRNHCEDGHQDWPARGRYTRHLADDAAAQRRQVYDRDEAALRGHQGPGADAPRLRVVDQEPPSTIAFDPRTGEVLD